MEAKAVAFEGHALGDPGVDAASQVGKGGLEAGGELSGGGTAVGGRDGIEQGDVGAFLGEAGRAGEAVGAGTEDEDVRGRCRHRSSLPGF